MQAALRCQLVDGPAEFVLKLPWGGTSVCEVASL